MFNHPRNVCMTYLEHFKVSMNLSKIFLLASLKDFIHAIYPDFFITSSTDTVEKAKKIMNSAGCHKSPQ